jgi:uncharacterized protein (UPF0332 family)
VSGLAPYASSFLDKARENLAVAGTALRGGHVNAATSRAYYAAYQAMICALNHGTSFRAPAEGSHKEVLKKFDELAADRGFCGRGEVGAVAQLKNERNRADYKPTHVDPDVASDLLGKAHLLVERVEEYVSSTSTVQ